MWGVKTREFGPRADRPDQAPIAGWTLLRPDRVNFGMSFDREEIEQESEGESGETGALSRLGLRRREGGGFSY